MSPQPAFGIFKMRGWGRIAPLIVCGIAIAANAAESDLIGDLDSLTTGDDEPRIETTGDADAAGSKAEFLQRQLEQQKAETEQQKAETEQQKAETEQKQAVKMLTALREELDYQVGKGVIDPRFGMDPDDALDLQVAMKGASMAMQRYVASVPAP